MTKSHSAARKCALQPAGFESSSVSLRISTRTAGIRFDANPASSQVLVAGPRSDLDPAAPKIRKETVLKFYACQPYMPPRNLLACVLAVIAQLISRLCRVNRFLFAGQIVGDGGCSKGRTRA